VIKKHQIVEVVNFRLKEGVADADFLREAAVVQGWVEVQPGFCGRELLKSSGDQWLDTVRWESLELAEKAAANIMTDDQCKPFMAMIDESDLQMWHFEPQTLVR
jgi:hypothetical protein